MTASAAAAAGETGGRSNGPCRHGVGRCGAVLLDGGESARATGVRQRAPPLTYSVWPLT